jgi:hypothetical protein
VLFALTEARVGSPGIKAWFIFFMDGLDIQSRIGNLFGKVVRARSGLEGGENQQEEQELRDTRGAYYLSSYIFITTWAITALLRLLDRDLSQRADYYYYALSG